MLLKASWNPIAYNVWRDPDGALWTFGQKASPDLITSLIVKSLLAPEFVKAEAHYDAKGMGKGIDLDATLSVPRGLKEYQLKCILESVMAACMWPNARINAIYPEVSDLCPRCGQCAETSLHTYWQCPGNAEILDSAVQDTQSLCQAAVNGANDEPCMWLRGLLPSHYTHIDPHYLPSEDLDLQLFQGW